MHTSLLIYWHYQVLALPGCNEEHSSDGGMIFRGPRVCMGMYKGQPTRVMPHANTGRADYFGPLVNRAARWCHAAASGGQIILTKDLVDEMVSWTTGCQVTCSA